MKKRFLISAADKEHFKSLINDFCKKGFWISYLNNNSAQLENNNEIVKIEY